MMPFHAQVWTLQKPARSSGLWQSQPTAAASATAAPDVALLPGQDSVALAHVTSDLTFILPQNPVVFELISSELRTYDCRSEDTACHRCGNCP